MTSIEVRKLQTLTGHRDGVYTVVAGDEPSQFFSGAGDGMVVLWDLTAPQEGVRVAQMPNSVYSLLHISDMGVLIAGHNYDGIHVLDWRERKELSSLKMTEAAIFDLQASGDDLFVASGDGALTVVSLRSMAVKVRRVNSQKNARTIAINPVSGEIAVGYSDNFIRVFDPERYVLKKEWQAHTNSVFTLRYSPDGRFLLSGSRDARLKQWDAADYHLTEEVVAHMYAINSLSFSPDGKHFVTCSLDKSIKLWDADQLKLLKVIDKARHAGHGTSVNKLLWTAHEGQVVSASDDRTISVWKFIF
ncbi:MAG TPA: cytochrome D1 domain-containing protein [Cyclobacteriaceae bacterium]|nr:cytochrome D1 domain-containing protein [Cyclobacteriaceae bacterium]